MVSFGSAGRSWSHSSTRRFVNPCSCICSVSGSNSTSGSEQSSIQSYSVSLTRSISCGTTTSSSTTRKSIMSLKTNLSMTKSSPYGLYFFLLFPILLWRVSMVKRNSGCTRYSTSVCFGHSQSSLAYGRVSSTSARSVNSRSNGRSQLSTTSFPSFLSHVPLSFTRRQGPLSNSLHHACQLGYTSPLMRHCVV